MNKFGKQFTTHTTKVKLEGCGDNWYRISDFECDRKWIRVSGVHGRFQREHVLNYTNRDLKGFDL
jgi:hypothetical protein